MGARKFGFRSRLLAALCFALSILAILLWGRLKLVTGVPRTAYADPQNRAAAHRGHAGLPAQERPARQP